VTAAPPSDGPEIGESEVHVFEQQRPRLFGIAYRMLGSAHDAEDVLQDAWLRWAGTDRAVVESPSAWLATVVTRLCLTRLTSARARRETYPGPWLPEPVLTPDPAMGPLDTAEQRESVSLALLVTLERLTPAERAVYVLREAFTYGHREIAAILDTSEANSRQLHTRARRHLAAERTPAPVPDRTSWARLAERFLDAARGGDLPALEALLAADVTAWSDGGGRVHAARKPVRGRAAVAAFFCRLLRKPDRRMTAAEINGAPALLAWTGDEVTGVFTADVRDGRVEALRLLMNPDKLAFLRAQLSRTREPPGLPS
jgi:RNA polymerase sigma-70 factor (TIGR02957 family)